MTDATGKLARWQLLLSKFDNDIFHRASMKHQGADALSCLHTTGTYNSPLEDDVSVLTVTDVRYGNNETETDNSDQFGLI